MRLTDWVTPMIKQTSKPSRCIFVSVLLPSCENESLNAAPSGRRIIWGLRRSSDSSGHDGSELSNLSWSMWRLVCRHTEHKHSSVQSVLDFPASDPECFLTANSDKQNWLTQLWLSDVKENKDKKITAGTHWSLFSCLNILWKSFLSLILIINKNVLPQFYFSLSMFFVIALLMSSWISSTSLWFLEIWDKVLIVEILCMTIIQYQATQIGLIFTISEILIHLQH